MKKALSLIFAFILAFTMMMPAFAADHEIGLGEPQIVGNRDGEEESAIFTPEKDGFYKFSYEVRTGSFYDVYCMPDFTFADVTVYSDYEEPDKIEYIFAGEKGTPVTVDFWSDMEESYRLSVEFSEFSCDNVLKNGENNVALESDGSFFNFVPEEDGYYNFKSTSEGDPMIEIIGTDNFEAFNDDNGLEDDFNFDLTAYLEAGKYLVYIYDYAMGDECDVTVTFGETEKVKELYLDTCYEDPYEMKLQKDYQDWFYLTVAPTGAIPTADITVKSSDEEVVSIDFVNIGDGSSEGLVEVSTHKAGKAVITVTADGITKEIDVRVYSDFQWFFINLWSNIQYFFLSIFSLILSIF